MEFDTDYVVQTLHSCPINFSYDGNGNYTISQKDLAVLLKCQHERTIKQITGGTNNEG